MNKKQIRIDQSVKDAFDSQGISINEVLRDHMESLGSADGEIDFAPPAPQAGRLGQKSSPPSQAESSDTTDNGPSGPVIAAYCQLNGHLEAVTYNEDSNGERIAHLYCARCKTTTKAPAATGDYTVVAVEPTYLGSYHPDR